MQAPRGAPSSPQADAHMHVTASDISLYSTNGEDDERGVGGFPGDGDGDDGQPVSEEEEARSDLAARALASEQETGSQGEPLARELLEALRLGTSNFLLAYNTRAGIAVLLRLFKLLQKRELGAAVDLRRLLGEKHLAFRVEAVRLGLFLGWFTGGYRGLRALLPVLLRKVLPRPRTRSPELAQQHETRVRELSALGSGALAALALGFVDTKRRRSLALYALTRALQCGYNTAKSRKHWHFWGSDWRYGDALLFGLASAQVMYAYVMRPRTLPPEYFRFIQRTGPVELETLTLVQQMNRGLPMSMDTFQHLLARKPKIPRDLPLPRDIVPCCLIHADTASCVGGTALTFRRAFVKTFPLYLSLFIVPGVVIHFKRFLRSPLRSLLRSVLNATRSNCFLASFVSVYMALACMHRRVASKDHRFVYYFAGLGASTTILLEPKGRRSELALYVLPRAIDSLAMILHDRGIFRGFAYGEVALFSASMAVMMYCYEHEKEAISPFVHSTMKRFLQTSTDKKQLYQASLEHREEQQRRRSQSQVQTPLGASTVSPSTTA